MSPQRRGPPGWCWEKSGALLQAFFPTDAEAGISTAGPWTGSWASVGSRELLAQLKVRPGLGSGRPYSQGVTRRTAQQGGPGVCHKPTPTSDTLLQKGPLECGEQSSLVSPEKVPIPQGTRGKAEPDGIWPLHCGADAATF